MSEFNSFQYYLQNIFSQYISRITNPSSRNIAIIDGENLLGLSVDTSDPQNPKYSLIKCGEYPYTPILEILSKIKAIDENTLVIITQKRNDKYECVIKDLESITGNPYVYIFVIQDKDVTVNIDNHKVVLNVVRTTTAGSYYDRKQHKQVQGSYDLQDNHWIAGFDDFIGFYIFAYLYELSQQSYFYGPNRQETINSISYYSGDQFRDRNSYITDQTYYLVPPVRKYFNGRASIRFTGFDSINIYSAKDNQTYQLNNSPTVTTTLVSAEFAYTREAIPSENICEYFKRTTPNRTIRLCQNGVNLQIHILGNTETSNNIVREANQLFNQPQEEMQWTSTAPTTQPTSTSFPTQEEMQWTPTNLQAPTQFESNIPTQWQVPSTFNISAEQPQAEYSYLLNGDYYQKKYFKYKAKYLQLRKS